MKDLKQTSGLPIKLEDIGLTYDQEIFPAEPATRTYQNAKEVYSSKSGQDQELYFMYRYFESEDDGPKFERSNLEFDITVIRPGMVGKEYVKTVGHYHGNVPDSNISYPEVYEVIDGKVEYLLQTKPDDGGNVDIVVVEAETGDKIVIPPNYGHISINVGEDWLVESNIQKRDLPATSDYDTFKKMNGGALYRIQKGWENNSKYKIRTAKRVTPKEKPDWGLTKNKPLYIACMEEPEKFRFLTAPQYFDFSDIWEEKQV